MLRRYAYKHIDTFSMAIVWEVTEVRCQTQEVHLHRVLEELVTARQTAAVW